MYPVTTLTRSAALIVLGNLIAHPTFASFVITDRGAYDPIFSAQCADGTVAPGASNPCEYAVVETKRGIPNATGGNAQLYVRTADFSNVLDSENIPVGVWGGTVTTNYEWLLEANQSNLGDLLFTVTIGSDSYTTSVPGSSFTAAENPSQTDEFYIRLAATGASNPSSLAILEITDSSGTHSFSSGNEAVSGAEEDYLQVEGIDFANPWSMSGTGVYDFAGSTSTGRPAAQFKLTQRLPVDMPIPATAALLLAGVVGVFFSRRKLGS